jgi:hypothetical protein
MACSTEEAGHTADMGDDPADGRGSALASGPLEISAREGTQKIPAGKASRAGKAPHPRAKDAILTLLIVLDRRTIDS